MKLKLCVTSIVLLLLSSCSSRKNFIYLQDMHPDIEYAVTESPETVIHQGDRLGIFVSSKSPELAIPFNVQGGGIKISETGDVSAEQKNSSNTNKGYRVDVNGNIDFPVLGKLYVEGLTLSQLTEMIKTKIIEGNYIKSPIVMAEFNNFKYYLMGALSGEYTVDGDRVTLLEAIARAGDLPRNARLDRVLVIRDNGDYRQVFVNDLRTRAIFDSPAFYLQQNDIVYIEPAYKKRDKEDSALKYGNMIFSTILSVISVIYLFK